MSPSDGIQIAVQTIYRKKLHYDLVPTLAATVVAKNKCNLLSN